MKRCLRAHPVRVNTLNARGRFEAWSYCTEKYHQVYVTTPAGTVSLWIPLKRHKRRKPAPKASNS